MTTESFALRLTRECGVRPGDHVLAAVSGGADSVALLCLLREASGALGITVSCAHVEHGIRGEASLGDMAFVRGLCKQLHIPFYGEQADVPAYARMRGMGLEEAARTLRYEALERIADQVGATQIALAHHALDQAETVLLHASRGSDVRGLCAMRWRRGRLIRPLLGETPEALRAYLAEKGQPWREDETNGDVAYARNRIRREAIPALERAYPGAVQALCRLAQAAQRDEDYFARTLDGLTLARMALVDGVALSKSELAALDAALLGRVIARELESLGLGSQSAETIGRIADAVCGVDEATVNLSGGGHAVITKTRLCLIRQQEPVADMPLRLAGETVTPFGTFSVRAARPGETGDGVRCQTFDAHVLAGAVITQRCAGDVIVPFGRQSGVKLKKLMIDAGVERPIRNSLPVIRKGEDILWAVGLRPSASCAAQGGERLMVTYRCK